MLAVERLGWFVAVPISAITPVAGVIMYLLLRHRANQKSLAHLRDLIDKTQAQLIAQASAPMFVHTQQLRDMVEATDKYLRHWQESEPMSPEAVAAVCAMVIDHLHLTIKDLDDENVVTTILTCCAALADMQAVAENDQEALEAALAAREALLE